MTKTTTITREICEQLKRAVLNALGEVEQEFGVKLTVKGGKFSPTSFTLPIEFSTIGTGGVVNNAEAMNFTRMSSAYGVDPSLLNTQIYTTRGAYKLIGLNPRSGKFPFMALHEDGRRFKLGADTVKFAIANATPATDPQKKAVKIVKSSFACGSTVYVKWTDDVWYDATYVRAVGTKHAVVFADGSKFRADTVKQS